MSNIRYLFYTLTFVLPLLCSCADNDVDSLYATDKNDMVEVSLSLRGLFDNDYESLTRAELTSNDLVAIDVDDETAGDSYYAACLFKGKSAERLLLRAGHKYSFKCIVVKDGVDKCYRSYDGSYKVTSWLGLGIGYGSSVYDIFQDCVFRNSNIWDPEYRPEDFVYYVGEVSDYYAMENGSVTIRMKSCKAPSVQFKFTSNIPDGVVFGTMTYTYQKQSGSTTMCTRSWSLNNSDEITFDRNPGLMTQVLDGTWWSGKEQMDFVLTWERGPEANSFITTHKNVTLRKTVYIDNDKNYIINLRFRGQSDLDPEIWIGVDVDPDHSGDLDEEDDSNE